MTHPEKVPSNKTLKALGPKLIVRTALILCIASGLAAVGGIYSYWYHKNKSEQEAKQTAKQEAVKAVQQIDLNLRKLKDSATTIADDLTTKKLADKELTERLKSTMQKNPNFFGVGAAYVPYAYKPDIRLYVPYYFKKEGQLQLTVQPSYDYTQPENEWYNRPLKEGGIWLEPFYAKAARAILAEFSTPFYRVDDATQQKKVAGVVYADYSLENLKSMMSSLNLGKTGYGFILSKKGVYISHPLEDFVTSKKSIFDFAQERNNPQLKLLGEKAIAGESGFVEVNDQVTGQSSWVFYEPIPSTGWTMAVVFFKREIITGTDTLQRQLIRILLATLAFLFFLSILVFRVHTGKVSRLWAFVYSSNALFIAGIGSIWYLTLHDRSDGNDSDQQIVLVSQAGLNKFLSAREELLKNSKYGKSLYIPTGLFIQSLEFNTANNVSVTGYVWQKFTKGIHDGVSRGFIMPESVDKVDVTESYRQQRGNEEVIGWYFRAKLRQNFDYSQYPLDSKNVRIRLWAKDFDKNVVLVPDFDAYDLLNPTSFPGMEKDLVLSGWKLDSSFFEYALNSYNTNFGLTTYVEQQKFPELYFTIVIKRHLLPIFIANVMPLSVVSFLLFALLTITRKKADGPLGFSAKDTIQNSAGLLFIVLLNQINLRGSIASMGIIYLEYFYFVVYLMVLLVLVNALLFVFGFKIRLIQEQDNLVPRLLYWPTLLGLLLMITVGVFY